jgi:hypothetical protein
VRLCDRRRAERLAVERGERALEWSTELALHDRADPLERQRWHAVAQRLELVGHLDGQHVEPDRAELAELRERPLQAAERAHGGAHGAALRGGRCAAPALARTRRATRLAARNPPAPSSASASTKIWGTPVGRSRSTPRSDGAFSTGSASAEEREMLTREGYRTRSRPKPFN